MTHIKPKAIIVDDEFHSRESLNNLLIKYCPQLNVVATAESVDSGRELIRKEQPDLIFLDVMMPDGNGFEILDITTDRPFQVIFTTAHDSFAVKAFQYAALDYLLKPISINMLRNAVDKFQQNQPTIMTETSFKALDYFYETQDFDKIVIPSQEGYLFIPTQEIIAIQANNNYSLLHSPTQKPIVVSKPLGEFEAMLSTQHFFRSHHSYLINIKHIHMFKHREDCVLMSNGAHFPVSTRKKQKLIEWCKIWAKGSS